MTSLSADPADPLATTLEPITQPASASSASATNTTENKSAGDRTIADALAPLISSSSSSFPVDTAAAAASSSSQDAARRQPTAAASSAAELARTKIALKQALRRFPDFPIKGIIFIDILPLFQNPTTHEALLRALELQVQHFASAASPQDGGSVAAAPAPAKPDVVVGLDARGFLFGPSLALRLGASFVPVRKKGKMPGPCVTATYEKEYGADYFQIQEDAIRPGQNVLVVDDIIATGGSAAAAGQLVKQLGGHLIGYLFILEISPLKGREKLGGVPAVTLLDEDEYV